MFIENTARTYAHIFIMKQTTQQLIDNLILDLQKENYFGNSI